MATTEYLCCLAGIDPKRLSKEENLLVEMILLYELCNELRDIYQTYFPLYLVKNAEEKKVMMTYGNIINLLLQDLLKSNDYTISGVAAYSNVPEEVIYDIAIGCNNNPSLDVSRKIIELHKSARVDLYQKVMQKITASYATDAAAV